MAGITAKRLSNPGLGWEKPNCKGETGRILENKTRVFVQILAVLGGMMLAR